MEQIQENDLNKSYVGMASCFICGKVKHLLLDKRLKKSLPPVAVYDKEPCDKCKKIMKEGVLFIGVNPELTEDKENPYRTGHIIGLKDNAIKNIIQEPLLSEVLKKRVCFVELEVLKRIGLVSKTGKLKHKKQFKP